MTFKPTLVAGANKLPANEDPTHPHFGKGGSYSYDPATGKTTLLERSGGDPTPASAPAAPVAAVFQPDTQE